MIEVRRSHEPKAYFPIEVTSDGIVEALHPAISLFAAVSIIELQPFLLS